MTPSFHHRPRVGGELTDSYETARAKTPPPTPRRWGDDSAGWRSVAGSTDTGSVEARDLACFLL